jgi:hypothetical protein
VPEKAEAMTLLDHVPNHIGRAFRLMQVAEEEIVAAIKAHPEVRDALWNSFRLLDPGIVATASDDLYRVHCRELLRRIVAGGDTRYGTDAELLIAFKEASLKAPLSPDGLRAYATVFRKHFRMTDDWELGPEAWQGMTEQTIAETRKRIYRADRVPKDESVWVRPAVTQGSLFGEAYQQPRLMEATA